MGAVSQLQRLPECGQALRLRPCRCSVLAPYTGGELKGGQTGWTRAALPVTWWLFTLRIQRTALEVCKENGSDSHLLRGELLLGRSRDAAGCLIFGALPSTPQFAVSSSPPSCKHLPGVLVTLHYFCSG